MTISEQYNYQEAKHRTNIILSSMIPFLVILYFLGFFSLYFLNRTKGNTGITFFWVFFVLTVLPFVCNQGIAFLACLIFLIMVFIKPSIVSSTKPQYTKYSFWPIMLGWTILYTFSCYFMTITIMYFFGTTTTFDLQNKAIYQDFIQSKDIPVSMEEPKKFKINVEKGKSNMSKKTVVFGCLARDIEHNFKIMSRRLEIMGGFFKDYRIVIFENDSKDDSRQLFKNWSQKNNRVLLLNCCEEDGNCECKFNVKTLYSYGSTSQTRIDKMRSYRQKILDYVKTNYSDRDYYIIVDFDIPGAFYLDGFFSSFAREDFDMVFARGLTSFPFLLNQIQLYDGFAFIPENKSFDYKENDLNEMFLINKTLNHTKIGSPWILCKSGFNGMAIYTMKSIMDCSYYSKDEKFKCEHIDFHYDMNQKNHRRIYFNPSMVLFVGHQGPDRGDVFIKMLTLQSSKNQ